MKKRARYKTGSVVFDKHISKWRFLQWVDGTRRSQVIGTKREFPSKAAAQRAAESLKMQTPVAPVVASPTVNALIEYYRAEKMPKRIDTRRAYEVWLSNHIIPKW